MILFSTSDVLLNRVLNAALRGLEQAVSFILEKRAYLRLNENLSSSLALNTEYEIGKTSENCFLLANSIQFIVRQRILKNFNPIGPQVKLSLLNMLNKIYIEITEFDPALAIQLAKIMHVLSLNETKS
jgi:hypothetical protein